jgi:hypothetical protein
MFLPYERLILKLRQIGVGMGLSDKKLSLLLKINDFYGVNGLGELPDKFNGTLCELFNIVKVCGQSSVCIACPQQVALEGNSNQNVVEFVLGGLPGV